MHAMVRDAPEDPDAQSTVNDFLDYTECLSSDIIRSLTLVRKLDESYLVAADTVHRLSKDYGCSPSMSPDKRPSARYLRQEISHHLEYAISSRESAYGEASRLYGVVDRHHERLANIISKLHALPKPPSRDPTPVPRSPVVHRRSPPPRITLRFDGARAAASNDKTSGHPHKRYRSRKITVPGEVLPPPNPDSPGLFTESDWESVPPSPIPMPTSRVGGSQKKGRIKPPKVPKMPKLKPPKVQRPPRPPGAVGTNVHSSVAGISTSNALSLLTPPPADAKPGSVHAPWMRLTEWEMAKLRKRMKKNAIWTPSETMIRRELSLAGRGPDNYKSTKQLADANGEEFNDEDKIATTAPGRPLVPGEISADPFGLAETNLSNRGMKLNEAKKLKREILAREQAAILASEAEKLGDLSSTFKDLFNKPHGDALKSPAIIFNPPKIKEVQREKPKETVVQREKPKETVVQKEKPKEVQREKPKETVVQKEKPKEVAKASGKKRRRDGSPKSEPEIFPKLAEPLTSIDKTTSKKRKPDREQPIPLTIATNTVTTTIPLAAPAPSPPKPSRRSTPATPATPVMAAPEKPKPITTPKAVMPSPSATSVAAMSGTATSMRPRRVSLTLKGPAEPPPEPAQSIPRTSSRNASRRGSTGPPSATIPHEHARPKSATPAPSSPVPPRTAAGRRSRRPAPGVVVKSHEGGAAVSVGKRQHAPKKRGGIAALNARRASENAGSKEKEAAVKAEEEAAGEEIDPNEPRYCYCGDVSWGDMVGCENDNVSHFPGS